MKTSSTAPNPAPDLVRFDHFMADALYGKNGYYTSPRPILGARGDFTTTPKLTKLLARRIAEWIQAAWKRNGRTLSVIELGPGDGTLAQDIRQCLPFLKRRSLDYHFVEISPHLTKRQQEKNQGTWHPTLQEALAKTQGRALIISNEFFDAFPVRIFNSQSEELFLNPQRQEIWQPASGLPDSTLFENPPSRFEVAESIHQWTKSDLSHLQKGEILTIDYGGDQEEVYHRRPLGSLRGYAHHMRLLPPEAYQNPGKQDFTFDVSFPDLIHWGSALGLENVALTTQADFLGSDDLDGAGGAFKVLHQRKT
ncbi:SAM-dependent methyltransferase [bacterium]|nr:SAM-dependent methyltransferase [bacterium]